MPEVARGDGVDSVSTNHACDGVTTTNQRSTKVFVNGIGVVRSGDLNSSHTVLVGGVCVPHSVPLTTYSTKVFVEGRGVGRKNDLYSGETITSGSSTVFAGG